MKKTATFISDADGTWGGVAKIYRLSPPLGDAEHVVVSAVVAPYSGPETYIFKSDAKGNVSSWGELDGSFRGDMDHDRALREAGYEVAE